MNYHSLILILIIVSLHMLTNGHEHNQNLAVSFDLSAQFADNNVLRSHSLPQNRLTEDLLKKHKWEEPDSFMKCSYYFKFNSGNEGISYGCNLLGTLKFKYKVTFDTLIIDQYNPIDSKKKDMKWRTGKYLYTGHSLLLIKAFEWNEAGELTEVVIPRRHEFIED